ncbi:MAG: hypothetical protein AVDCRST_MAG25-3613 [uncultured Rubrobacteraceae bacterium]|uniref:UPF0235 protein AVDCRST_MAG25-3613 n=1 Tax=uncultured Rubrobacteraceae bacterium TaxID=349277 RepID=A0A6J4SCW8_9ACTN|nr:MAG: hypothetical protein AVDCRST_MAG25-3613 [uncultured Rubrobacteraceae bacterium]
MASANLATNGYVRPSKDGALVRLRVSPGAKTSAVKGLYGEDAVKISVAAPPVDGKANAEVERFVARLLGMAASDVAVVHGASSRDKSVLVRGYGEAQVLGLLEPLL